MHHHLVTGQVVTKAQQRQLLQLRQCSSKLLSSG
jgi:hypothetical protein